MKRPHSLVIGTCNICNANCVFCAYRHQTRPKKIMDDHLFKLCLQEANSIGGESICIGSVVGDCLLDRKIIERIAQAKSQKNIKQVAITTNIIALSAVGAERLLRSGVNSIHISTSGFDKQMYESIFRNNKFEIMKNNLLDLLRKNHEMGSPVVISVDLRIDRPIQDVKDMDDFDTVIELANSVSYNLFYDSWNGKIKQHDLIGSMKLRPDFYKYFKKIIPCVQLFAGGLLGVSSDGIVTACACRDLNYDSELVLGNIKNHRLQDLIDSGLKRIIDNWQKHRWLPQICRDCTHYIPYTYLMLPEVRKGREEWQKRIEAQSNHQP